MRSLIFLILLALSSIVIAGGAAAQSLPTPAETDRPRIGLVLGGGGARGAYQAGVLRGIGRHLPELRFPIITGASAGAINAIFLLIFRHLM